MALIATARAAFQPNALNMNSKSQCQVPATIKTGGAANR